MSSSSVLLIRAVHDKPFGKTEMWYVVSADKDAHLMSGLSEEINTSFQSTGRILQSRAQSRLSCKRNLGGVARLSDLMPLLQMPA